MTAIRHLGSFLATLAPWYICIPCLPSVSARAFTKSALFQGGRDEGEFGPLPRVYGYGVREAGPVPSRPHLATSVRLPAIVPDGDNVEVLLCTLSVPFNVFTACILVSALSPCRAGRLFGLLPQGLGEPLVRHVLAYHK